jgi:hypothetical protein
MKWPFHRPKQSFDVEARVEALERKVKAMEVEWDEWYDKYRRLYARLSKRVERDGEPAKPTGNLMARRLMGKE